MAKRLSFKDAVDWLTQQGYEFGEKKDPKFKYYIKKEDQEVLFENGTKLVQWVREQSGQGIKSFNKETAEAELVELEKELKKYNDMKLATKDHMMWQRYNSKAKELEIKVNELKLQIEADGKVLSPNRLRQVLKDAGYENEESYTTAVKGWHEYSGDFKVTVYWEDRRYLDVTFTHYRQQSEKSEQRRKQGIIKAVQDAGYEVVKEYGNGIRVDRILK